MFCNSIIVTIKNSNEQLIVQLNGLKLNSIVEIKENVPDIVVGGINEIFADKQDNTYNLLDSAIVLNGGSVDIKMTISVKESNELINETALRNKQNIGLFLDITMMKIVTDYQANSSISYITSVYSLLKIIIPLDSSLQGYNDYILYRVHQGNIEEIKTTPNKNGEYIELSEDNTYLILHVNHFSDYAIGYNKNAEENDLIYLLFIVILITYLLITIMYVAFKKHTDKRYIFLLNGTYVIINIISSFLH